MGCQPRDVRPHAAVEARKSFAMGSAGVSSVTRIQAAVVIGGGDQRLLGEDGGLGAVERRGQVDRERDDERRGHGRDFAPGIDAPPIPAQQVDAAGSGADFQQHFPAGTNRRKLPGNAGGENHEQDRDPARDGNVVALRRGRAARSGDRNPKPGRNFPS